MITLAEVFHNPTYTFCIGLAFGLWVAANVWFMRYARGYRDGVKYCTDALEPALKEIKRIADRDHHISEAMRQEIGLKMQAKPDREAHA
jgi:hypothetical protein